MATHNITLDVKAGITIDRPSIAVRQGERGSEIVNVYVTSDGQAYNLAGKTAAFCCTTPSGHVVVDDGCTVAGNVITYTMSEFALASAGRIIVAYFDIFSGGEYRESTDGVTIDVLPSTAGSVPDRDYLSTLDQVIAQHLAAIEGIKEAQALLAEASAGATNRALAAAEGAEEATREANANEKRRATEELQRERNEMARQELYARMAKMLGSQEDEHALLRSGLEALGRLHTEEDYMFLDHTLQINDDVISIADGVPKLLDLAIVDGAAVLDANVYGLE